MNPTQTNIQQLLKQYREGMASPEERALLEAWYHALEYDATAFTDEVALQQLQQAGWQAVVNSRQPKVVPLYRRYRRVIAVAAMLVLALAGWWLFTLNRPLQPGKGDTVQQPVIMPGGDKAVLTLANGKKIILEQADSGAIAEENGVRIIKRNNGQLAYGETPAAGQPNAPVSYNTLAIPRGGQYQLILPDGTRVLMNSASSLTYPTVFSQKERVVTLSGEAWFEVMPNAQQPFKVKVNQTTVDVLGTQFNIHAYADEPAVTTTLVQGSVRVGQQLAGKQQSEILTPGLQAVATQNGLFTRKANLRHVLAWKNGLFIFEDRKLADVLREIARWYDIAIEMQAPPDEKLYGGVIFKSATLQAVLNMLERGGTRHFKIEGRKVLVLP